MVLVCGTSNSASLVIQHGRSHSIREEFWNVGVVWWGLELTAKKEMSLVENGVLIKVEGQDPCAERVAALGL